MFGSECRPPTIKNRQAWRGWDTLTAPLSSLSGAVGHTPERRGPGGKQHPPDLLAVRCGRVPHEEGCGPPCQQPVLDLAVHAQGRLHDADALSLHQSKQAGTGGVGWLDRFWSGAPQAGQACGEYDPHRPASHQPAQPRSVLKGSTHGQHTRCVGRCPQGREGLLQSVRPVSLRPT